MSETICREEIDLIFDKLAKSNVSIKLNIGCGDNKLEGYINIDSNPNNKPDIAHDILDGIPLASNCVDEILFFHTIEHIEERCHSYVLNEFFRVLKPDGILYVSYPEFTTCAMNYIEDHLGLKEFWKNTIYGLQRAKGDFHVALMDTKYFVELLQMIGFKDIEYQPEADEPYNTIVRAVRGEPLKSYEELLADQWIHGDL